MNALLKVQLKALAGSFFNRQKRKKHSKGYYIFITILVLYLGAAFVGLSCILCNSMLGLCEIGLDWMYFAFIGIINLAFGVLMNVFLTQNMLYEAKDNDFLLSLPINPGNILFVRMLSLLVPNVLISIILMLPAGIIYGINFGFGFIGVILFALSLICFPLIIQSVSCVFGWLLNKLYSKLNNKAIVSFVYMIAFLAAYFYIYPKFMDFMNEGVMIGTQMSGSVKSYGWLFYAYGKGCEGDWLYALAFVAICVALFALVYMVIRYNYLKTLVSSKAGTRTIKKTHSLKVRNPINAICFKEFRRFVTSPVYLTNVGVGIILIPVMAVCGIVFKDDVNSLLNLFGLSGMSASIIICVISVIVSMACITAPSVSLEGKSLWIIKSLPLSGVQVIKGKLSIHCMLLIPVSTVSALVLCIAYNPGIINSVICVAAVALTAFISGVLGLIFNLLFPRFDWVNETGPCKQSMSVLFSMLSSFVLTIMLGLMIYLFVKYDLQAFCLPLQLVFILLLAACLYAVLIKWGAKRFEKISE